ncbi:ArsR/SmtB family transcription factor [Spongisporangium articulatum]|uniref:ArsR/SmtB family transcription factor n=1 Tax=Spongisporangium articulatum TaxID=3362603 RepID=A0ABW8ARW2_9ACTN
MSKQAVQLTSRPGESGPSPACCTPTNGAAMPVEQAVDLAKMFKALGDPVRLRLLSLIAAHAPEACVCDLTDAFDLTGPTISYHLKTLRQAGLVDCVRRGTWVYYWIRPEVLTAMGDLLAGFDSRPQVA